MTHFDIGFPDIEHHDPVHFSTEMPKAGSPVTERPDDFELEGRNVVHCVRKFFNDRPLFPGNPDGSVNGVPRYQTPIEAEVWTFEDDTSGRRLPAPLIRAREGDVVRVLVEPSKQVHTIHLHGIEPDPRNDGVGHTSYEVSGSYEYLFSPQIGRPRDPDVGTAGSYFYHCHVNTVLHVQMGMFGPLVIDPIVHPDYPVPLWPRAARRAFVDGPAYDVGTETFWATYAIDQRWHELGHAAGLAGEDVGLNRFEPSHFFLLGAEIGSASAASGSSGSGSSGSSGSSGDSSGSSGGSTEGRGPLLAPRVTAHVSEPRTLVRIVNGTYIPVRFTFPFDVDIIATDGRPLRDTKTVDKRGSPRACPMRAGSFLTIGAAERYDLLLKPKLEHKGLRTGRVEFGEWIPTPDTWKVPAKRIVYPEIAVVD